MKTNRITIKNYFRALMLSSLFRILSVLLVSILPYPVIGFVTDAQAQTATGRIVVIDGMNLATTIDQWSAYDHPSTDYLYTSISSDWRTALSQTIGPVQPFYWSGDPAYTGYAVESLTGILRDISDQNKITNAPLVIIAHSWGTALAYITLKKNPDIIVDKLITMGSPLGQSVLSAVGFATRDILLWQGVPSIDSLPNVGVWHNYWTACDWVFAWSMCLWVRSIPSRSAGSKVSSEARILTMAPGPGSM